MNGTIKKTIHLETKLQGVLDVIPPEMNADWVFVVSDSEEVSVRKVVREVKSCGEVVVMLALLYLEIATALDGKLLLEVVELVLLCLLLLLLLSAADDEGLKDLMKGDDWRTSIIWKTLVNVRKDIMLAAIRRSQALNWELPDRTAWAHCPAKNKIGWVLKKYFCAVINIWGFVKKLDWIEKRSRI